MDAVIGGSGVPARGKGARRRRTGEESSEGACCGWGDVDGRGGAFDHDG